MSSIRLDHVAPGRQIGGTPTVAIRFRNSLLKDEIG